MKICICTTPIRPQPTTFPPFGSMAIIQSLRSAGEAPEFYNIDYFRYSRDEVARHFAEKQFDIVGISAVVSTAYAYTKFLAQTIRAVSPQTVIVVGGNLAASAEILLRKCGVDYCVIGDGEIIMRDLVAAHRNGRPAEDVLRSIKGICFLEPDGRFNFTGYGPKPTAEQIESPDYGILEADGSVTHFVNERVTENFLGVTGGVLAGERLATVIMAKGCVARCTFCHRFEKGYRQRPIDQLVAHIRMLKERFHVRYINIGDENFGSDREVAFELATELGRMGMTWYAAGVRARTVRKDSLAHWKANGCVAVVYGIESGSQKILDIMEKNATVEENINALKWTAEAGLGTVVQLVIGMPGETDQTIEETIDFLRRVSPYLLYWRTHAPSEIISINYAQALPGTPLYEFARERGFIGTGDDDEERYLLRISDTDAYAEDHFINYTGLPLLKVLVWRPFILAHLDAHHFSYHNPGAGLTLWQVISYYARLVGVRISRRMRGSVKSRAIAQTVSIDEHAAGAEPGAPPDHVSESGYFNIQTNLKFAPLLLNPLTRHFFYPALAFIVAFYRSKSFGQGIKLVFEYLWWRVRTGGRPAGGELPSRSLRSIVSSVRRRNEDAMDRMMPLRSGR